MLIHKNWKSSFIFVNFVLKSWSALRRNAASATLSLTFRQLWFVSFVPVLLKKYWRQFYIHAKILMDNLRLFWPNNRHFSYLWHRNLLKILLTFWCFLFFRIRFSFDILFRLRKFWKESILQIFGLFISNGIFGEFCHLFFLILFGNLRF